VKARQLTWAERKLGAVLGKRSRADQPSLQLHSSTKCLQATTPWCTWLERGDALWKVGWSRGSVIQLKLICLYTFELWSKCFLRPVFWPAGYNSSKPEALSCVVWHWSVGGAWRHFTTASAGITYHLTNIKVFHHSLHCPFRTVFYSTRSWSNSKHAFIRMFHCVVLYAGSGRWSPSILQAQLTMVEGRTSSVSMADRRGARGRGRGQGRGRGGGRGM